MDRIQLINSHLAEENAKLVRENKALQHKNSSLMAAMVHFDRKQVEEDVEVSLHTSDYIEF